MNHQRDSGLKDFPGNDATPSVTGSSKAPLPQEIDSIKMSIAVVPALRSILKTEPNN